MGNKTLYPCTCNSFEYDPECVFHFSKETRVRITPEMQNLKHCYQISHQEAYEHGMVGLAKKRKLLNEKENYESYKQILKVGSRYNA